MRLTFLGHAAFLIEAAGQRIITDPYSSQIGYAPIRESADIVTISHHNPVWHSCLDELDGEFEIVNGMEILEKGALIKGISFGSLEVFERKPNDGPNAMVWLESEGIRVLHMGDCGVLPRDEVLEKCGRVDVLLALAGGFPTIALPDLMTLVEKLKPQIVVPMHYGVPGLKMKAVPVTDLEAAWRGKVAHFETGAVEISAATLPAQSELYVLSPTRLAP